MVRYVWSWRGFFVRISVHEIEFGLYIRRWRRALDSVQSGAGPVAFGWDPLVE